MNTTNRVAKLGELVPDHLGSRRKLDDVLVAALLMSAQLFHKPQQLRVLSGLEHDLERVPRLLGRVHRRDRIEIHALDRHLNGRPRLLDLGVPRVEHRVRLLVVGRRCRSVCHDRRPELLLL